MDSVNPFALVSALLALHFAVFGWRIAREISVEEKGQRTWLLLSDFINFVTMLAVVTFCVVIPLANGRFPQISRTVLGAGYMLIVFTPLIIAGHYRLFSRLGRRIYAEQGRYAPRVTDQEAVIAAVAILSAAAAAYVIHRG